MYRLHRMKSHELTMVRNFIILLHIVTSNHFLGPNLILKHTHCGLIVNSIPTYSIVYCTLTILYIGTALAILFFFFSSNNHDCDCSVQCSRRSCNSNHFCGSECCLLLQSQVEETGESISLYTIHALLYYTLSHIIICIIE